MAHDESSGRGNFRGRLREGRESIRAVLSQLATRTKKPEVPSAPVSIRPVPEGPRWGPLVLLDKVGEGSFGEVYRAWDVTLEREVALKLMRAAAEDPTLVREGRMLARVRHPNVVTVYGADRHDNRSGVWMDFIEGDTLAAIVEERGSFGAMEALLVGVDVCRALAAVHHAGLLHRDIKAQNVMRERGGRIVLMDFGLGHEAAAGPAADFGGTPLYIAPELFRGEPASVRSDIYAAGVLLFHLVSGAYPVRGSTIRELYDAHADQSRQTLRDLRPDLPSSFAKAVEKAIASDPARRYATAGQMTAALEAALGTRRVALPLTRRAFWWTASSLAGLAAAAGWYRWKRPSAAVGAGASLLLTEISNATGDPQLNAATDVLRVQIAQSAHFNLLDAARVKETLARMTRPADQKLDVSVAREVALRSGTPLLVYGTLSPLGVGYGLSLIIERIEGQPLTPKTTESKLFEARSKSGLFDAIHQAATWIRQTAGEAEKDISANDTQPEEATTDSWDALEYFARGERLKDQLLFQNAVSMYKQALTVDPGFALALARVGQYQITLQHKTEAFTYWRKADEALKKRRVTRREGFRIRSMHAAVTEDFAAAEQLTQAYIEYYPYDPLAHHYHALALTNLDRLREAREELLTSYRLQPSELDLTNLISVDLLSGQRQDLSRYLKTLRPLTASYYSALARFLDRDFDGCDTQFREVTSGNDARLRSSAWGARACLLAELGRHDEAQETLAQGIASDEAAGQRDGHARKLLALAHLRLLQGQRGSARAAILDAVHYDRDTVSLRRAGTLLARAGFVADAGKILDAMNSYDEGRRFETARAIVTGEVVLAEGHVEAALAEFAKADQLAPPSSPREFLANAWQRAKRVDESLAAWRRLSDKPARIWVPQPEMHPPGMWTEALLHVAELSIRAGRPGEGRGALNLFLEIRKHADSDSPQSILARKLLAQYEN